MVHYSDLAEPVKVADWPGLEDRKPNYALVENTDLVVIRYGEQVSVLYGRCLHRGALPAAFPDLFTAEDFSNQPRPYILRSVTAFN